MIGAGRLIRIVFFTAVLAVSSVRADDGPDPIQIGGILILSGEGAAWGDASKNGIDLAVEKINAEGGLLGRPVEVAYQDDQGDPKKTISAFQYMADFKNIDIIVGPTWSTVAEGLIGPADRKKILMISPSLGLEKFNESSPYLFNTYPHDSILSKALADYVYGEGRRNIVLIGAEDVWVKAQTDAFKEQFLKRGGKIAYLAEPLPKTTDLKAEALRIKTTPGIDAYVSTTDGVIIGSLVARELKNIDVKLPMYSITLDQTAIDAAQGGFEGLKFLSFLTPTTEFRSKYETRFRKPIDMSADSAYDAVMLIADAIRATGSTDTAALAAEIAKVQSYNGASGRLLSDGKRGFTKAYAIKHVVGGKPLDFK